MADKLAGVHPDLQMAVPKILQAMAVLGFEMRVTDGVRTLAQQQALFEQGRSTVGPNPTAARPLGGTVTNADGVRNKSNHQPHGDGLGRAVDCAFWVDGTPSWAEDLPWRLYAEMAKALGLRAGADWGKPDKPHIERA